MPQMIQKQEGFTLLQKHQNHYCNVTHHFESYIISMYKEVQYKFSKCCRYQYHSGVKNRADGTESRTKMRNTIGSVPSVLVVTPAMVQKAQYKLSKRCRYHPHRYTHFACRRVVVVVVVVSTIRTYCIVA